VGMQLSKSLQRKNVSVNR